MAEKKKEPLSLNQRHNRLLEDLSVSHSKSRPPSSFPFPPPDVIESKVKPDGRRLLCKASSRDDDVPQFFGIEDFDSPSPVQINPSRVELFGGDDDDRENRPTYNELVFPDCQPSVSDNPLKVQTEVNVSSSDIGDVANRAFLVKSTSSGITSQTEEGERKNKTKHAEQSLSSIADFDSSPPVKKPSKVKTEGKLLSCGIDDVHDQPLKVRIEGRKRLCKAGEDRNKTINDEPNFSIVADFESPPPKKDVSRSNNGGGQGIRDILNDLSKRMDILSIEKRRVPKMIEDSPSSVVDEGKNRAKKEALSKYTAVESLSSNNVGSLSDATNDMANGCEDEKGMQKKSEGDKSVCRVSRTTSFGGRNKNECTKVGGKCFNSEYVGKEDSDDDCIVLSGHNIVKDAERQRSKLRQKGPDDFDEVETLDDDSVSVGEEETSFVLSDPKSTYRLPSKIAKMLYPHQRDGLKWLWSLHCQGKGGILGDDMGLGKTMQICGFLAGLFHSRLTKRALIVAPKTLLPHWMKELSTVGLSEKTKEYFGTCAKAREYELQYILQHNGILLTTYDIVRNNTKSLCGNHYFCDRRSEDDITWDYMILDEGHLIKNPSTQRAKSLLEISSAHRIIISGTPIQNNLKELWALFNFCCPELLGDKNWFKEKYESAILRGNDKSASDRDKRIGSAVAKELRARIQPYFLRRLKDEVFRGDDATSSVKLSKKNEVIVWLRLTSCQRQLYEAFLKSELVLSAFDGSPLAALTILKKICDHPLLLTKRAAEDVLEGMDSMLNQDDHGVAEKLAMHIADVTDRIDFVDKSDVSCKIYFIISLLGNLIPKGHNVLIFSQTRKMLNLIQESLASKGYEYLRIDGTTKASDRAMIVNKFQEGNGAPIFLLTSQVGGLGLTLTKADRVIVVDPAWNPSTDNQSVDRAYRIGQEKDVIVYRLMTCGTVEEKIYRKQIYKGGLFKSATEHKEQIRYFSQQDLRELFSLPKQGFDISLTQQQLHEEHDCQHTMDNYLKDHIKFLENLGIAGVSHHSLLFSKTAPVPGPEEELIRLKQTTATVMGGSSSCSSVERHIDGAEYAFNPKDVKLHKKKSYSPNTGSQPTETEVKERINRLTQILRNKAMVSNLPDKGERITKQIAELNLELDKILMDKRSEKKTIYLDEYDDISRDLQRVVLNV